jgi:hypothetical protein
MSAFAAPPAPATEQEFTLRPADFERVRQLIYKHAGISLHAGKQAMVYSRLSDACAKPASPALPTTWAGWKAPPAPRRRPSGRSS